MTIGLKEDRSRMPRPSVCLHVRARLRPGSSFCLLILEWCWRFRLGGGVMSMLVLGFAFTAYGGRTRVGGDIFCFMCTGLVLYVFTWPHGTNLTVVTTLEGHVLPRSMEFHVKNLVHCLHQRSSLRAQPLGACSLRLAPPVPYPLFQRACGSIS
jgi:hypothetical protein